MNSSSKALYIVGIVISVFVLFGAIFFAYVGFAILGNAQAIIQALIEGGVKLDDPAAIAAAGGLLASVGIVGIVIELASITFAVIANMRMSSGTCQSWNHIVLIVLGVLGNIFYLIGGIIGVASRK